MDTMYRGSGIRFEYPADWGLTEDRRDDEFAVTVTLDETTFWSVTLLFQRPEPERVLKAAVAAFREEYPELDVYPVETELAHHPAKGRDIEFICWELTNSAFLRAFRTGRFTVLVMYQVTDQDLAQTQRVFDDISRSLECEADGDVLIT